MENQEKQTEKKETREELLARIAQIPDKQDLTLVEKKHEYGDIYSFLFKPERPVHYAAGQYIHMLVHDLPEDVKPTHHFSIASAPSSDELVQFTTHVREGSAYKQAFAKLAPGDKVSIFKVKGDFIMPENVHTETVLIAGGIGITPFRAMMREEAHENCGRPITLVHVASDGYLFESELSQLPFSQHRIKREELDSYLTELAKEKKDATFFVSGPPPFVDALKEKLMTRGIPENRIKQDWFDGYENVTI